MMKMAFALAAVLLSPVVAAQDRPEFEVASIRPSAEQVLQVDIGMKVSGSQVRFTAMSLKDYIGMAYGVKPFQISGPEWLGQLRFDVAAKIPDGVAPDQVDEMLQTLLADRFALRLHRETRELPVYALVTTEGGAKLQPAAGSDSTPGTFDVAASGTGRGVAVDLGGGSSFNVSNNRVEIKKLTMREAAELLERFVDRPMVDATGLQGRYDLTLDLTPEDYATLLVRAAVNGGIALPPQALRLLDGASSDPFSGSLQKFGLKLDARRAPMDVLVIDAMEKAPSGN